MTLTDVRDLLVGVDPDVEAYHYVAKEEKGNYIVWAEESDGSSGHADNKRTTKVMEGTIDYFTKTEYDPIVDKIEKALNDADMGYKLSSIQHEDDTGYIHYEWEWEIVYG